MWGLEASVLLSLENSKLFLCPVYLIDSQHLSGSQSISLSPLLHHSHFWQLNTRSKPSVTRARDTGTRVTPPLCEQPPFRLSRNGLRFLVHSLSTARLRRQRGDRSTKRFCFKQRRRIKRKENILMNLLAAQQWRCRQRTEYWTGWGEEGEGETNGDSSVNQCTYVNR